jgi:hypothetical protein
VNRQGGSGFNALTMACRIGSIEMASILIDFGASGKKHGFPNVLFQSNVFPLAIRLVFLPVVHRDAVIPYVLFFSFG